MKSCDNIEEGILRRALRGVLPECILLRRKSPYPKTHNPPYLKLVKDLVRNIIEDSNSPILQLVNKDKLTMLIDTDAQLSAPHGLASLWEMYSYLHIFIK